MCSHLPLIGILDTYYADFFRRKRQLLTKSHVVSWDKPNTDQLMLNTNTSDTQNLVTSRGILWDSNEKVIGTFYKEFGKCDVINVEGCALFYGS